MTDRVANPAVLAVLEYDKIIHRLAAKTASELGRQEAQALQPSRDIAEVRRRLEETKEALSVLSDMAGLGLGGVSDVRPAVRRAEIGSLLDFGELLAIRAVCQVVRRIKGLFRSDAPSGLALLPEAAARLQLLPALEQAIENTVDENGELRDTASPRLASLRREMRTLQGRIRDRLEHIIRSSENQKYLQEALITIRGDRYVVPVKQEYRNHFPGIVHDQSASGATVFIEPMAVVNLNNDLKKLSAAEKAEIERILREISRRVAEVGPVIRENCRLLAYFDFCLAKARLALEMRASLPSVNDQGWIDLRKARHPLIPADAVVPIDVQLGRGFTALVITGPNTGGKTVTLRTIGLLSLLAQSGLFIPAASGSETAVFRRVFADIGDEQAIEQNLSTFSSHMTNLISILREASADDLVLIDEVGAGTDPEEGAALAMAILEHLIIVGARTAATTHYSELKTFAAAKPGIVNASVEFDVETLMPTYRLLIGVPGSSNAFAISQRLGLDKRILERAQSFLSREHNEVEKMLISLEEKKRAYERDAAEAERLRQDLEHLKRELSDARRTLASQKADILRKAREEAAALLRGARRTAEAIIDELKARPLFTSEAERQSAIAEARRRLAEEISSVEKEDDLTETVGSVLDDEGIPAPVEPGATVYVASLRHQGTVLAVEGGLATVQIGSMKVNVPVASCRVVKGDRGREPVINRERVAETGLVKAREISPQIDIRGLTVEEAIHCLEKYLDDALMAGLPEVKIIHGKGTGALRKGVREYLLNHPRIKEVRIAELNQGGTGVSVARF